MADLDNLVDDADDAPTAPFWMVTFSDMVTLLLTFFVLIVAMSEVEIKKFEEALSYFQGRPNMLTHDAILTPARPKKVLELATAEQIRRYEELLDHLKQNDLQDKVSVNLREDGMHVIITDSVMFRSGEASLIEPSRTILRMIADALVLKVESIVVEGHTDDRPIATAQFPSNWELSGARASSVVRFLLDANQVADPSQYTAIGHGEHHPRETNGTPEGRSKNRRVEILFSWQKWQNPLDTPTRIVPKPVS